MLVIMVILITLMIIPLTFDNAGRGELAFRTMWSEFEWENKININTSISEVNSTTHIQTTKQYLHNITTN